MKKSALIPHALVEALMAQATPDWLADIMIKTQAPKRPNYVMMRSFTLGPEQAVPAVDRMAADLKGPKAGADIEVSLLLTNLQLLDPLIAEAALMLEKHFECEVFCNLFFTPGPGRDVFVYHSDFSDSVILQLQGQKTWHHFQNPDGTPVVDNKQVPWVPKPHEIEKTFVMEPGSQVTFGHGEVHTAKFVGNVPSIHLNFSTRHVTQEYFLRYLMFSQWTSESPDINRKLVLEPERLEELTKEMIACLNKVDPKEFAQKFLIHDLGRRVEFRRHGFIIKN